MSHSDKFLNDAMLMLAARPNAIFIGQNVAYPGTAMYRSLDGVPTEKRLELPVIEEMQMGISVGLALQGFLPISIYQRCDFLLRAMDALVNHLDKLESMSRGQFVPKIIIRTRVGSRTPLDPGPQHSQDHTAAFAMMLTSVTVMRIDAADEILPVYRAALESPRSSLVVESLP